MSILTIETHPNHIIIDELLSVKETRVALGAHVALVKDRGKPKARVTLVGWQEARGDLERVVAAAKRLGEKVSA